MNATRINDYRLMVLIPLVFLGVLWACGKPGAQDAPVPPKTTSNKPSKDVVAPSPSGLQTTSPKPVTKRAEKPPPATMGAIISRLSRCNFKASTPQCKADAEAALELSRSDKEDDRIDSLRWLTLRSAIEAPGALDRLLQIVNRDPNQRVRREACRRLGRAGHPKLLAAAARYTLTTADTGLYASCFEGLVEFWASPGVTHPSAEAYALTLKRLQAKPRRAEQPPAAVFHRLRRLPIAASKNASRREKLWTMKVRAFFRPNDLVTTIEDVVTDANVAWQTRLAAIETLIHLQTPRTRLAQLAERLKAAKGEGLHPLLLRLDRFVTSKP